MRSACRALSLSAIALAMACSPAPDGSLGRSGEWLVDSPAVDCSTEPLASASSDGRWLAFWLSYFRPDTGMTLPVRSPALFDWAERALVLPAGPADRTEGRSFDPTSLCWDDPDQRVFVRVARQSGADAGRWFEAGLTSDAELAPTGLPPSHCRRPAGQQWQWSRPETDRPEIRRGLSIQQQGCCEIALYAADGQLLASHETQHSNSDQLIVTRLAWSGDGQRLAYTLSEQVSWRFARPSPTYVVTPGHSPPELLEGRVFSLFWQGEDHLIGCAARRRVDGGGSGLKLWRFSPITVAPTSNSQKINDSPG